MRVKGIHSPGAARSSISIAWLVLLCCSFQHSLSQDGVVRETSGHTEPYPQVTSKVTQDRGEPQREKEEARKAIDEISNELLKTVQPPWTLYVDRGHSYMVLGDCEKAFEDYTKALESPTRRGSAYFVLRYRVMAAVGKGDYAQAVKDATELTKSSPPQPEAFAILALVLARSPDDKVKSPKESLDCAVRASTIATPARDVVLVETALAAAYCANGDFKQAVAHQEKAIAATKGNVTSEMKAQLEAYKAEKEYPFPFKKAAH